MEVCLADAARASGSSPVSVVAYSRGVPTARRLALLSTASLLVVGLGGCKYAANLSKVEWVVIFKPGATQAQHRVVLDSCSNIPHVDPEPLGTGTLESEQLSNVRFRVDNATDADLAKLSVCLEQPQFATIVQSYDPTDPSH
jgi:hypothetical protein